MNKQPLLDHRLPMQLSLKRGNGHTVLAFSIHSPSEAFYVPMVFKVGPDGIFQHARTLSVYYGYGLDSGKQRSVDKIVDLHNSLVAGHSSYVKLGGHLSQRPRFHASNLPFLK